MFGISRFKSDKSLILSIHKAVRDGYVSVLNQMNLMTILVMKMICDQCLRTFQCPGRQISQFLQAHTENRTIQ